MARNFCEDFAPRDEAARLCEERGANRAAVKAAGGRRRRGISVKILLPGTEPQGFAGSGEQIAPLKRPPVAGGAQTGRRQVYFPLFFSAAPGTEVRIDSLFPLRR